MSFFDMITSSMGQGVHYSVLKYEYNVHCYVISVTRMTVTYISELTLNYSLFVT